MSAQGQEAGSEEEVLGGLLEWRREVEAMLEQVGSLLFFRYRSNTILVRDVAVYFFRFLQEFHAILEELHKGEEMGALQLLVYLDEGD